MLAIFKMKKDYKRGCMILWQ